MAKSCSVESCTRTHYCRSFCERHYRRFKKYGDPLGEAPVPEPWQDRFWRKVVKGDGCWLWTGHRGSGGYGRFWLNGKQVLAHRTSWEITNGPIPDGLYACHRCDNPPCVKPAHLFLGTALDNAEDRDRKGRTPRHPNTGLRLPPKPKQECSVDGCDKHQIARSYCDKHYRIWRLNAADVPKCSVDGCNTSARTRGFCENHYKRWFKYGDPLAEDGPIGAPSRKTSLARREEIRHLVAEGWRHQDIADAYDLSRSYVSYIGSHPETANGPRNERRVFELGLG